MKGLPPLEEDDENACDPEDFELLFAAVVNAQDGERTISEPFHLLPYKTVSTCCIYLVLSQPYLLLMFSEILHRLKAESHKISSVFSSHDLCPR